MLLRQVVNNPDFVHRTQLSLWQLGQQFYPVSLTLTVVYYTPCLEHPLPNTSK